MAASDGASWLVLGARGLALAYGLWYCSVWCVCIVGYGQLRFRMSNRRYPPTPAPRPASSATASPAAFATPGVSIIRPLKGVDTEFESCILSAFEQAYPIFEILLCVDDPTDPAIPIVRDIMARYPKVPSRLFIGAKKYGVNPKVNNMIVAYDAAAHDIIWILDSNCWVTPGTLTRAVATFACHPRVELVHHVPICVAVPPRGLGARLDEMFMSTAHAKFYVGINTFQVASCITGKSNLFRRSTLNKVNPLGIQAFSQYIAEDQMIGEGIWALGGRHAMSEDVALQPVSSTTLTEYFVRRMRWLRVRKYIVTAATMVEPFTECFLCGGLATLAISVLENKFITWFFPLHVAIWCAFDFWLFYNLHAHGNAEITSLHEAEAITASDTLNRLRSPTPYFALPTPVKCSLPAVGLWLATWMLRETLALPIWITAMLGTKIVWRNRLFFIRADSTAVEIRVD
ncbi:glycosyl transferase family 21-domain-containing protein [Limtongia smithiae]|uniref:glycosyl transferase family 21-domain-containing protein n=1 Tax=Limtongia smithiae TaxID=1125753 RepID=UPI0034CDB0DA